MRRTRFFNLAVYVIASALILISAGVDASAQKKSRGRKASSSTKKSASKKDTGAKSKGKKSARERTARAKSGAKAGTKSAKSRAAKSGRTKLSRRERRALARKEPRGRARYASRSARARSEAPPRASEERDGGEQEPSAPQPRIVASGIQSERVIEIQNALTKAGVFEGPSTGQYDESTSAAMKKFQVSNGLPATGLPSAHTLKKLGVSKRSNDGYAVPVSSSKEKRQEL